MASLIKRVTWFLAGEGESGVTEEQPAQSEVPDVLTRAVERKVTADMMIEFIGQEGAKTCEELAGKFWRQHSRLLPRWQ